MSGAFGKHCPFYYVVLWYSFSLFPTRVTCERGHHYWIIFKHEVGWPLRRSFICFGPLSSFLKDHRVGLNLRLSIPSGRYAHCGAYEWDCSCLWPPFDPNSLNWVGGQGVKVQALKSMKDLPKHKDSLGLHFGHKWLVHFGCVNGFLGLCHTFFGWIFIAGHGTYQWSSSLRKHLSCFGHFVFMCSSLTFIFHLDIISFSFLVSFDRFW
jgi:hypothetical protein